MKQVISKAEMKEADLQLNEGVYSSAVSLTIAAIALGAAVIYSLGLINLTEMSREFATLKVLGFRHKEIRTLVFRENLLLTAAGIILAMPAGLSAIIAMGKSVTSESLIMFPVVQPLSYALAAVITLLCSYLVNALVSRKIARIDMVGSLKSVE
ncbi:ABC transporter permease [Paenibacillus albidus]|uniref:ABC transporter permease n=1 Tax=Paenibacillus albidus TaxID=2041023 RepID=UPI001BE70940|nr:ABC transporter permease [Paenibacillus albidus]MBT2289227.1 ABC transporter permease [Paenibacillus albidus]